MSTQADDEPFASGAALKDSLREVGFDDADLSDDEALRFARIDDYRQEALRGDDSLESTMGAHTGGLLKFAAQYEQTIAKFMEQSGDAILNSPELQRAMNTYLNLSRQMDRNVNLTMRLAERRANLKSQRRQVGVPGVTSQHGRVAGR